MYDLILQFIFFQNSLCPSVSPYKIAVFMSIMKSISCQPCPIFNKYSHVNIFKNLYVDMSATITFFIKLPGQTQKCQTSEWKTQESISTLYMFFFSFDCVTLYEDVIILVTYKIIQNLLHLFELYCPRRVNKTIFVQSK